MSKTIHFYNCFIKYNGRRTNISISNFIDQVYLTDPNEKFRELRVGEMSLLEMVTPDPTNANTYQNRSVGIAKYRDKKPYTGQKRTDVANVINSDVLEMTSVIALPQTYMLLIEYNHYGARPSHIQCYLDSFLPKGEGNYWEVELIPIEPERGLNDVVGSRDIKYIEFKLNLQAPMPVMQVENNKASLLVELLELTRNAHESFGANTATVCFGNGRNRQDTINARDLIVLIKALDLDSEVYESVKVKYRSPATGNIEHIDLKHAGILKRIISTNNDGWEYIVDEMQNDYLTNNRPGSGYYVRYLSDILPADLPELVQNNEN